MTLMAAYQFGFISDKDLILLPVALGVLIAFLLCAAAVSWFTEKPKK
jgi:predicted Na+-dependent transporter